MKRLLFILFLLPVSLLAKPNAIDSIKTDEDVIRFLNAHLKDNEFMDFIGFDFKPYSYAISQYDSLARALVKSNWEKADFDKNGLTDLLVYDFKRTDFYIVLSLPHDKFNLFKIGENCYPVFPKLFYFS